MLLLSHSMEAGSSLSLGEGRCQRQMGEDFRQTSKFLDTNPNSLSYNGCFALALPYFREGLGRVNQRQESYVKSNIRIDPCHPCALYLCLSHPSYKSIKSKFRSRFEMSQKCFYSPIYRGRFFPLLGRGKMPKADG